jgi:UDP-glucose:(heptosyl)LPS alpha-1,3-glucosyltransferase
MEHRVPCVAWPRTARFLSFAYGAPKIIAQYGCDVVLSFDRIAKQDVFRSGGGPHGLFLRKMERNGKFWRSLWHPVSPYHRSVVMIEKRQMSRAGSRKIIAVCQQIKRDIIDVYGVPEEKIAVVHNGVDHERFHPRRRLDEGRKVRDQWRIPTGRPVVLFVGTGFRRKGLERLLRLWNSPQLDGVYLLVVGNDSRLAYYRRAWNRKEILFVGAQTEVESYYAAADLFVLPSIQEAFGNAVLEALASGLPVITVPGVGPTDKMEGGLTAGILTNPDDPEELRTKILEFLNPERWPSLSVEARRVAEKFSWERYLDEVEGCLRECATVRCLDENR